MNFFHALMEKPWLARGSPTDLNDGAGFSLPTATLGLRVFLAVVTVLFSLLVVSYIERMAVGDWRSLPDMWLLWANTALLISSSVGLHWARVSVERGRSDGVKLVPLAGGGFAFAFLAGQLWVAQQLTDLGYFAASNPAVSFFYLLTALHGLHLLGGLVALGKTADKVWGGLEMTRVRLSVELCATYWHFLLLVWLVLFGLLLLT